MNHDDFLDNDPGSLLRGLLFGGMFTAVLVVTAYAILRIL